MILCLFLNTQIDNVAKAFFMYDGNLFYRLPYITESGKNPTTKLVRAEILSQEFL
jgi:hypothetical protein